MDKRKHIVLAMVLGLILLEVLIYKKQHLNKRTIIPCSPVTSFLRRLRKEPSGPSIDFVKVPANYYNPASLSMKTSFNLPMRAT